MSNDIVNYKKIIANLTGAYAYRKIITDKNGSPVDYEYIDVNSAFEDMTGFSSNELIGKKASEIMPGISIPDLSQIQIFADVALKGKKRDFEFFSEKLQRWYQSEVYCPEPGYFITISHEITLLKKIEDRIDSTENKYKKIIDTASEGIWEINEKHSTIYVNSRMAEMLGYTREEMIGEKVDRFIFHNHLENFVSRFTEIRNDDVSVFEARLKHKTGKVIWTLLSATPVKDDKGIFQGAFAMFTDITERKKLEYAIIESQQNLKSILNGLEDIVLLLDTDGNIIEVNDAYARMVNKSREVLINTNALEVMTEKIKSQRKEFFRKVKSSGEFVSFEDYVSNRTWLNSIYPVKDSNGNVIRIIAFSKDITERKLMEEKLIISEEKFRLFFEKSPYAIVNLNREGKLLKVNNEFLRITGYDMSDVENLYTFDMVFPEDIDRAKVRLNRVLKEGYVHEEIRIKSKNNKTLFINIEIIKISENEFIGFWKDVTQKKKMEEQIKVSEEKFRSYFDYSPNPITIFNKFGKILNSNKAAHKLSGYSHKEIISRSIFDVVSEKDADKAVEDFSRLLKEGKGITRLCIRRKDGTEMLIKMNVTRIKENEYLGFWEKLKDTD